MKQFCYRGEPQVWMTAAALAITLLMALTLILVVIFNGLGAFWPQKLATLELNNGQAVLGQVLKEEPRPYADGTRMQLKVGNRDLYGLDFRWVDEDEIKRIHYQDDAVTVEREAYGDFYGTLNEVMVPDGRVDSGGLWQVMQQGRAEALKIKDKVEAIGEQINTLNYAMEKKRNKALKLDYKGVPAEAEVRRELARETDELEQQFQALVKKQRLHEAEKARYVARFQDINGRSVEIPLARIVRSYKPNDMHLIERAGVYTSKLLELFYADPRESNTEGGVVPRDLWHGIADFCNEPFFFPHGGNCSNLPE